MNKKSNLLFLILLSLPLFVQAQSHYPGQHKGKMALTDKFTPKVYNFDLQDVRLLDSPFKENLERSTTWMLSIPVKSLLHSFRTNAGVFNGNEGGYFVTKKLGGWESLDCDLRGHTTGHILSGLAMAYGSTGIEAYKIKADSLVKGLAEVQEVLGQDGYLSAFPQNLINRAIAGKSVWAPWYTQHKIFSGLIDQYLYCDNKTALDIVKKMSAWAYKKLSKLTPEQRKTMLRNEFGGMNDSFYNLYAITGNPNDKWLAEFFYHEDVLDPLKKGEDILNPKHANTFIPKLIGLTRDLEIEGDKGQNQIADFFWNTMIDHHSFCTGSNSDKEHFFQPDMQSKHLTGYTGESCNVYNTLKLTRHLFSWKSDVKYMDYYERALYNHILGQQDPATSMVAYFLPMLPGAHKVYSTPNSSFWCCVGTSFESQAKFGEEIYTYNNKGVMVNLFIPSVLTWKEKGLTLRQETQYPEEETTRLIVEAAPKGNMTIAVRYPAWAVWGATVKVNGKKVALKQKPGSYIELTRNWQKGDRIELTYAMKLHVIRTPDNANKAAIAYGPIILAGEMGTKDMVKPAPYSDPKKYNDYYTYKFNVPEDLVHELTLDRNNLDKSVKPVAGAGKLTFQTVKEGFKLEPIYRVHRQRYVIYWDLK